LGKNRIMLMKGKRRGEWKLGHSISTSGTRNEVAKEKSRSNREGKLIKEGGGEVGTVRKTLIFLTLSRGSHPR